MFLILPFAGLRSEGEGVFFYSWFLNCVFNVNLNVFFRGEDGAGKFRLLLFV